MDSSWTELSDHKRERHLDYDHARTIKSVAKAIVLVVALIIVLLKLLPMAGLA